jgi:hypothetical protein
VRAVRREVVDGWILLFVAGPQRLELPVLLAVPPVLAVPCGERSIAAGNGHSDPGSLRFSISSAGGRSIHVIGVVVALQKDSDLQAVWHCVAVWLDHGATVPPAPTRPNKPECDGR